MKQSFYKLVFCVSFLLSLTIIKAQNIQVLYDTQRECVTSTVEMFKPDYYGSTFFFIDLDYSPRVQGAYFEIARELCFWQQSKVNWLSVHAEFNGGMNSLAGSFDNAWLLGLTYSGHSADFSKTWSLSAMYKAIPGNEDIHNFQVTGVWGINFAKGWCTFSGFADFWREKRPWQNTEYIFIAEPQFWVNLNKIPNWERINLSLGGEIEASTNFVNKGSHIRPAVGAKWTF